MIFPTYLVESGFWCRKLGLSDSNAVLLLYSVSLSHSRVSVTDQGKIAFYEQAFPVFPRLSAENLSILVHVKCEMPSHFTVNSR